MTPLMVTWGKPHDVVHHRRIDVLTPIVMRGISLPLSLATRCPFVSCIALFKTIGGGERLSEVRALATVCTSIAWVGICHDVILTLVCVHVCV